MTVLAQAADAAGQSATAEAVLFWVFAAVGLGAGIAMILMRNIVHAALMLVLNFLSIAALYLVLQSSFLGIIQVIVYAGAIVVLFLFVIMLLGVDRDDLLFDTRRWHRIGAGVLAVAILAAVLFAFGAGFLGADSRCGGQAPEERTDALAVRCVGLDGALAENDNGSVGVVADRLFTRFTFPFEAASLLLVVATIGALVLGRRHEDPDDEDLEPSAPTPSDEDVDALVAAADADGPGEHDDHSDDRPDDEAEA